MAIEVFPTANDIGGSGTWRTGTEENMVQTLDRYSTQSSILSGMTLPASAVDLDLEVAAGRAWIDGYLVRFPAAETVTITASSTVYLWIQLTGAGDSPPAVTATAWVETATLTNPGNAALVGEVTTSGSAITGTDDEMRREGAGYITGTYEGDGSGGGLQDQAIDIGATPRAVTVTTRAALNRVYSENAEVWVGNAALPTRETASNIVIIKDGFRVYDDDASVGLNDNGRDYTYIAHF
tara:strand:- start:52 stop:765 length:714 start_codon:yes stop_codon:yes gene_type:complete